MATVWVLVLVLYSGNGSARSGWATSQQVGPYPTEAACQFVRGTVRKAWDWSQCIPRMKTKQD